MNIVIDIQGFRDVEENFIPKEVTVFAINATITGLDYDAALSIWRFIRESKTRKQLAYTKLSQNRMI